MSMTVAQVIEFLSKIKDKNTAMMIDCPFCGHGNQLCRIDEVVLLKTGNKEPIHHENSI